MTTTETGFTGRYTLTETQMAWLTANGIGWERDCLGGYTFTASIRGTEGRRLRLAVAKASKSRIVDDGQGGTRHVHCWYSYMGPARATFTSLRDALEDMIHWMDLDARQAA